MDLDADGRTLRFEILAVRGCPHAADAFRHLAEAIDADDLQATIEHRIIQTSSDTLGTAFAGSPTLTLDGRDLFPLATPTPDLACRLYPSAHGLQGAPSIRQIRSAVADHV